MKKEKVYIIFKNTQFGNTLYGVYKYKKHASDDMKYFNDRQSNGIKPYFLEECDLLIGGLLCPIK